MTLLDLGKTFSPYMVRKVRHLIMVNEVLEAMLYKYPYLVKRPVKLIYNEKHNLYITDSKISRSARVTIDGKNMINDMGNFGLGGTDSLALVQLILWHQGKPHYPAKVFENWHKDKLSNDLLNQLLVKYQYDTPELCKCVLCGKYPIEGSVDWWTETGWKRKHNNSGPSCEMSACRADKDKTWEVIK